VREIFVGSERLASGGLTRSQLRWNYAPVFPGVYLPKTATIDLRSRIAAAWLWSGRSGIIAGRAAASLHGAKWIEAATPIELIGGRDRSPNGIIMRNERIDADEVVEIDGMLVTSSARTALDLGRHLVRDDAVRHLDALAGASGVQAAEALSLASRHRRARGLHPAKTALGLMDAGGQSPMETRLRLWYIDAGFPRPTTQIRVTDGFATAFLDMGWEEPMVSADYDGEQHCSSRRRYVHDIGRNELVRGQGWIDVHVVAEHSRRFVIARTADAFARRGYPVKLR
jgi:hypothetical protein